MVLTKIHVTLKHFKIAFKFSLTLPHRLTFLYGSCLVQALKLYDFLLL
jgi:hypothetical protein